MQCLICVLGMFLYTGAVYLACRKLWPNADAAAEQDELECIELIEEIGRGKGFSKDTLEGETFPHGQGEKVKRGWGGRWLALWRIKGGAQHE